MLVLVEVAENAARRPLRKAGVKDRPIAPLAAAVGLADGRQPRPEQRPGVLAVLVVLLVGEIGPRSSACSFTGQEHRLQRAEASTTRPRANNALTAR